jgi:hypothetical protein
MKRYIRATTENHDVFEMSTHTSYYDNFLNEKDLEYMRDAKNRDGEIVMMTPDEYFEGASEIFNRRHSSSELVIQRSDRYTDQYVEDMKNGDKFPLCYLNFADPGQEGLHRMLAAKRAFGPDVKYPVLVVTVYDQSIEDEKRLWGEISQFEQKEFRKIVDYLESHIANNYHTPPDNLEEIAEQFIQGEIDYYNDNAEDPVDITFKCKVENITSDEQRLCVYLTGYNGYKFDDPDFMQNSPWFDNMFDYAEGTDGTDIDSYLAELESKYSDDEIDKILSKDLDIDELLSFLKN